MFIASVTSQTSWLVGQIMGGSFEGRGLPWVVCLWVMVGGDSGGWWTWGGSASSSAVAGECCRIWGRRSGLCLSY